MMLSLGSRSSLRGLFRRSVEKGKNAPFCGCDWRICNCMEVCIPCRVIGSPTSDGDTGGCDRGSILLLQRNRRRRVFLQKSKPLLTLNKVSSYARSRAALMMGRCCRSLCVGLHMVRAAFSWCMGWLEETTTSQTMEEDAIAVQGRGCRHFPAFLSIERLGFARMGYTGPAQTSSNSCCSFVLHCIPTSASDHVYAATAIRIGSQTVSLSNWLWRHRMLTLLCLVGAL